METKDFKKAFHLFCYFLLVISVCSTSLLPEIVGAAEGDKPNIVVIWGDDIGQSNISSYSMGVTDPVFATVIPALTDKQRIEIEYRLEF